MLFWMLRAWRSMRDRRSCMRSLKLSTRSLRSAFMAWLSRSPRRLGMGLLTLGPPWRASWFFSTEISFRSPEIRFSYSLMW